MSGNTSRDNADAWRRSHPEVPFDGRRYDSMSEFEVVTLPIAGVDVLAPTVVVSAAGLDPSLYRVEADPVRYEREPWEHEE